MGMGEVLGESLPLSDDTTATINRPSHRPTSRIQHYWKRFRKVAKRNPAKLPYHIVSTVGFRAYYSLCTLLPLQSKKVFFATDRSRELEGNMLAVYNELNRRDLRLNCRFMLHDTHAKSFGQLAELAYHLATSKYIFLDDYYPKVNGLKIRTSAELTQLWHAVGAFKRFGFGRLGLPGAATVHSKNHRNYTKAIVSSVNVAKHYAESFGIPTDRIISTGAPRTDVLFDEAYKGRVRAEIYEEFPLLKGKKIITYAPTFRGGGKYNARFDLSKVDLKSFSQLADDNYVCLWRMHPFVKDKVHLPDAYSHFFIDVSSSRSMNDWLLVTDILVTDYSSACFEAALLEVPMVFFAFDLETYTATRDFYYDYEQFVPGPIVRSTDELIGTIRSEQFYTERRKQFVNYFFDHLDGRSSARVVDWVMYGAPSTVSSTPSDL